MLDDLSDAGPLCLFATLHGGERDGERVPVSDDHGRPPLLLYLPARVRSPLGPDEVWPLEVYRLRDVAAAILGDDREAWAYDLEDWR
ncbi:hypothetical protein CLV92_10126 [Kineococcus xinjiangensis]|uniref:Uncharacterized protein n=1 Tax=Kineococcus xinjiangensis TaxID=512762 RepID=A0A2S6IW00_9ACTN|nr:hypothetical protein [Kineococcus xinjiangensis]PPK98331.1 hypothetical protein CLV92_10126 [Kineococcus xinjiangensis]